VKKKEGGMSSAVLLHQLQVLEQQRNGSSSTAGGKRKRASSSSSSSLAAGASGLVNRMGGTPNDNNKKKAKRGEAEEDVRAKRFKAALEQLAAQGTPNKGRGRQRVNGMQKTDALVAAVRKANAKQQANRTRPNLTRLRTTDRATAKSSKSSMKTILSLSGRSARKKKEPKWHIQKESKELREVPKW
jgi:hypothetical protein